MLCALVGCGDPEVILTVDDMTLVSLEGPCSPRGPVDHIDVTALGDFPPSDALVVAIPGSEPETRIRRFPLDTELLSIRAQNSKWQGAATTHYSTRDAVRNVLLLPLAQSCGLPDAEVHLPADAAFTAVGSGAFLLAGGTATPPTEQCPSTASVEGDRRAVLVSPDGGLARVLPMTDQRIGATATFSKGRVVVVGGSAYQCEHALDTFETIDLEAGELVFESHLLCPPDAPDCVGRRDHAAGVLADGRILVYGGVEQSADPVTLRTGLIIDPANPDEVDSDLVYEFAPGDALPGRRFAEILTLDNGMTYLVGGRGDLVPPEDTIDNWLGWVYAFDLETKSFLRVNGGEPIISRIDGTGEWRVDRVPVVALPRARMAFIDPTTNVVTVARFLADRIEVVIDELELEWPERPNTRLESPRAVALPDGTVLVTARVDTDDAPGSERWEPRAWIVDVGFATVTAVEPSSLVGAPDALLALSDGVVAELDETGGALRRQLVRTAFDNPPATLLPTDRTWLTLDSPEGARFDGRGVAFDRDARVIIPTLALATFALTLQAEPGVDIELFSSTGDRVGLLLRPGTHSFTFGLPTCAVEWDGVSPVRVERYRQNLTFVANERRTCREQRLPDRVEISFRLAPTAAFESVQIERLDTP
jgi:hypothetical protein